MFLVDPDRPLKKNYFDSAGGIVAIRLLKRGKKEGEKNDACSAFCRHHFRLFKAATPSFLFIFWLALGSAVRTERYGYEKGGDSVAPL